MIDLILTEEQVKLVTSTAGPMRVCDAKGQVIGHLEPELTPEMIAELKRIARSPGPRYTGAQVQARLHALQLEWDRNGPFDEAHMKKLLEDWDAADPGTCARWIHPE